ncbi:MAG: hypothetical protein WCF90_09525 [Methanomicrobiales archaeon]
MTPIHRYIGNPILTWMTNVIFQTCYTDTHSRFHLIYSEALDRLDLKTCGMEFDSEMLVMASKDYLNIAEVPIDYYPRITPFKLHSFADGWLHIRCVPLINLSHSWQYPD